MTDPMRTSLNTDSIAQVAIDTVNVNSQRRHWWDIVEVTDTTHTVDDDTEYLNCNALTTDVDVALSQSSGQVIIVYVATLGSGREVTVTPRSGQTVEGADSTGSLVMTSAGKWAQLIYDDTSSTWRLMIDQST